MDLLIFDEKKRYRNERMAAVALDEQELAEMTGGRRIEAILNGGLVQVVDHRIAEIIHEMAGFGEWLEDEREENVTNIYPIRNTLILSPIETVFLSIDMQFLNLKRHGIALLPQEIEDFMRKLSGNPGDFDRKRSIYRFLRRNGWIVRSGATMGCDFLIYCLGADHFHSSAGVLCADEISPLRIQTLTRILAHGKKALMVATTSSEGEVKIVTMKTYYMEREIPKMSHRANELYELNAASCSSNKID